MIRKIFTIMKKIKDIALIGIGLFFLIGAIVMLSEDIMATFVFRSYFNCLLILWKKCCDWIYTPTENK